MKQRDRRADNRYFIDNTFLKTWGAKLGPHCIAVYNVLAMHADADSQSSYPSFQTIADLTGMSRRQVVREIEKLKANNIIQVEERTETNPESGKPYFLTNVFTLLHPDEWARIEGCLCEPSDTQSLGVVTGSPYPSDTQSPPLVTQSHLNNTHLNKTHITTPNGVGKKLPVEKIRGEDKTTPLWQLMNEFVKVTGIQMPHNASRKKDWWAAIREIYEMTNRDIDVGKRLIGVAVEESRQGTWSVTRPGSLINTIAKLMAKPKQRITAL